jgi:hypothetical protein
MHHGPILLYFFGFIYYMPIGPLFYWIAFYCDLTFTLGCVILNGDFWKLVQCMPIKPPFP